jgi:hypothetical protein
MNLNLATDSYYSLYIDGQKVIETTVLIAIWYLWVIDRIITKLSAVYILTTFNDSYKMEKFVNHQNPRHFLLCELRH